MNRTRSSEQIDKGMVRLVPMSEMYSSGLSATLADERRAAMKRRIVEWNTVNMPMLRQLDAKHATSMTRIYDVQTVALRTRTRAVKCYVMLFRTGVAIRTRSQTSRLGHSQRKPAFSAFANVSVLTGPANSFHAPHSHVDGVR
jgi:hypothetical protein